MLKVADLRKIFEKELKENLKINFGDNPNIKITKNRVQLFSLNKINVANIYFEYSNLGICYYITIHVDMPELDDFIKSTNPPYKAFDMSTLDEYLKVNSLMYSNKPDYFSPLDLPQSEEEAKQGSVLSCEKLEKIYLPKCSDLIELKPEAIADIIDDPTSYAYPFLLILYIAKKNKLKITDLDVETILSKDEPYKGIIKDKEFDNLAMLEKHLK